MLCDIQFGREICVVNLNVSVVVTMFIYLANAFIQSDLYSRKECEPGKLRVFFKDSVVKSPCSPRDPTLEPSDHRHGSEARRAARQTQTHVCS